MGETAPVYIRGKSTLDDLEKGVGRIVWTKEDCLVIRAHLAHNQVTKANCHTRNFEDICHALGIMGDANYNACVFPRLQDKLKREFDKLVREGHVSRAAPSGEYRWAHHTRTWADPRRLAIASSGNRDNEPRPSDSASVVAAAAAVEREFHGARSSEPKRPRHVGVSSSLGPSTQLHFDSLQHVYSMDPRSPVVVVRYPQGRVLEEMPTTPTPRPATAPAPAPAPEGNRQQTSSVFDELSPPATPASERRDPSQNPSLRPDSGLPTPPPSPLHHRSPRRREQTVLLPTPASGPTMIVPELLQLQSVIVTELITLAASLHFLKYQLHAHNLFDRFPYHQAENLRATHHQARYRFQLYLSKLKVVEDKIGRAAPLLQAPAGMSCVLRMMSNVARLD